MKVLKLIPFVINIIKEDFLKKDKNASEGETKLPSVMRELAIKSTKPTAICLWYVGAAKNGIAESAILIGYALRGNELPLLLPI